MPTPLDLAATLGSALLGRLPATASPAARATYAARAHHYTVMEAYYEGDVYRRHDELRRRAFDVTVRDDAVPRAIRAIVNPVRRAVDWWPGHVYPGTWTSDGRPDASGKPNRVPYDGDTPDELRLALQTAFGWGNWEGNALRFVRTGATIGEAFAEVRVDLERRKVHPHLIHPRHLVDLAWNATRDLTMYHLQIPRVDETGQTYLWGKRVDKERITTYRDDRPQGYDGQPAEVENPYGFVPAVLAPHRDTGGAYGAGAAAGLTGKIDNANGVLSAICDFILLFIKQPRTVYTDDPAAFARMLRGEGEYKAPAGTDPAAGREALDVFAAKYPGSTGAMIENLGLGEAETHVARLIAEIEADLPELTLSDKLLAMSQVTRPGALPLVQDVQHKFDESAGNYDMAVVALGQMCVSIMGHELREGTFGPRSTWTDGMRRFAPFSLDSYDAGDLSFSLSPRSLVPPTMLDLATEAAAIEALRTPTALRRAGMSDEEIFGPLADTVTEYPRLGILAERDDDSRSTSDLLGRALNAGI